MNKTFFFLFHIVTIHCWLFERIKRKFRTMVMNYDEIEMKLILKKNSMSIFEMENEFHVEFMEFYYGWFRWKWWILNFFYIRDDVEKLYWDFLRFLLAFSSSRSLITLRRIATFYTPPPYYEFSTKFFILTCYKISDPLPPKMRS